MKFRLNHQLVWACLLLAGLSFSCKDDDVDPEKGVNEWIFENMNLYYYWNDKIPERPNMNLQPEQFFNSLLNTYDQATNPEGDRFSFIVDDAEALLASINGESKSTGMEVRWYLDQDGVSVFGQVLYTESGAPAENAGLQRGDFVIKIDGQSLNKNNVFDLFGQDAFSLTKAQGEFDENGDLIGLQNEETVNLTSVVWQTNPVYTHKIFTEGGRKIGYFLYNQFIPGPHGSKDKQYDQAMDQVFAEFKSRGVEELVVDLRYNPGGAQTSANNLASLIAKGVDGNSILMRQEYNDNLEQALKDEYGEDFFIDKFQVKEENIGDQLNRVYFLVSGNSASASELVINCLKPYMTVILVGETTYGKNVGSITIKDESQKIKWGMQPIIVKTYNSAGDSDYTAGFAPNPGMEVTEGPQLHPFGSLEDPLLAKAVYSIVNSPARVQEPKNAPKQWGTTIERKRVSLRELSL
ncbi:S41 family peptidase [Rapidithrix thailandica]|uniref:S41 family peptidase n=1 Tax=Rapidithrix thailandica TaxID=413964 RepID=A0AAW9SFT2_9BACT